MKNVSFIHRLRVNPQIRFIFFFTLIHSSLERVNFGSFQFDEKELKEFIEIVNNKNTFASFMTLFC